MYLTKTEYLETFKWNTSQPPNHWKCNLCYENDGLVVIPFDKYKRFTNYRIVIDVCPRCKRELYGGLEKWDGFKWHGVCDIEEGLQITKKWFFWNLKKLEFNWETK